MTIYSQHRSRGKVQILATYRGSSSDVMSSTVTSVDDVTLAVPIVDALNRISACATVPVSVYDTRDRGFNHYPIDHIAAITDRTARADLLSGAHSLWYEHVKTLLHRALGDLDDAATVVPTPVQTAISAELEAEARGLREALAEFSEGIEPPEKEDRRSWDFEAPFVAPAGVAGLSHDDRDHLDRREQGITNEELRQGVTDLRLLHEAYARCTSDDIMLQIDDFSITYDPFTDDHDSFIEVLAPMPDGDYGRDSWEVVLCRWEPDPKDEDSATGERVLQCTCSTPPSAVEIVNLLNRCGDRQERLSAWSQTPVGQVLTDTAFVVTKRYDDEE